MRPLIRSTAFVRAAKRALKTRPNAAENLRSTLEQLTEDAFHPNLRTPKLRGDLDGFWACSAGYDLRVIFLFVQDEGEETIFLQTVGTHDEVY